MKFPAALLLPAVIGVGAACGQPGATAAGDSLSDPLSPTADTITADSLRVAAFPTDSLPPGDKDTRYTRLSDEDFRIVAEELGVEVAAIKAVVEIEAGKTMHGFAAPGVPIVNFDQSMYNIYSRRAENKAGDKSARVPSGISGYALKEWTQLTNARRHNSDGACMGTFWGMFQIGGFNYKLCGCKDVDEFVRIMSESEFSQLELFAKFITNSGMLPDLKNKNWAGFARKFNGASYARRGYHTRMAAAYRRYKST